MAKPKHHIFICVNKRPEGHPKGCCSERGALDIWQQFAEALDQSQRYGQIKISGVRSCLGPCQHGPIVVVYPDNVWYIPRTKEDVVEIFNNHLLDGNTVERLMLADEFIS